MNQPVKSKDTECPSRPGSQGFKALIMEHMVPALNPAGYLC